MTARHAKKSLQDSLTALLPGAQASELSQADWHSATFSGFRVTMQMTLTGKDALLRAASLQSVIEDHEFDLRWYLVADIAVTSVTKGDDAVAIVIEALLLEP
jgi:hypothetical protein